MAVALLAVTGSAPLRAPARTSSADPKGPPPRVAPGHRPVVTTASFGVVTFNLLNTRAVTAAGRIRVRADVRRLAGTTGVDLIGFQEARPFLPMLRATLHRSGWQLFAPRGIEDPIAWRSSAFSLDTDRARSAQVWAMSPGVDREIQGFPDRFLTRVLLRHRPSGRTVEVFNTHVNQFIERSGLPRHNVNWRWADLHLARLGTHVAHSHADVTVGTGDFNVDAVHDAQVRDPRLPFRRFAPLMESNYRLLGIPRGHTALGGPLGPPSRVDYVFLKNGNLVGARMRSQAVLTTYRHGPNASDHAPVLVQFSVTVGPRGSVSQAGSRSTWRSSSRRPATGTDSRAAVSACHTTGRGTARTERLRVGISATAAVSAPSTAIAVRPPTPASRPPASRGANGMIDIETNCVADCTRPWSSGGVSDIR